MLELNRVHLGDCRELLRQIPEGSVHCVVTSPPYWGLRDYGLSGTVWGGNPDCPHEWGTEIPGNSNSNFGAEQGVFNRSGQGYGRATPRGAYCTRGCGAWLGALGLEPTMAQHLANIVEVFNLVRRALHPAGTIWVNYGDAYAQGGWAATEAELAKDKERASEKGYETQAFSGYSGWNRAAGTASAELKPKQLLGLPWRTAFALQDAGWWLRSDCIWHKPNALPESVQDRPGRDHEYVFLLTKSARYSYDRDAVRVPHSSVRAPNGVSAPDYDREARTDGKARPPMAMKDRAYNPLGRNLRTVWTINTEPTREAHFATFPRELVRRCIQAGSPAAGLILDPFAGSGTTGVVAAELERDFIGLELNPDYCRLANERVSAAYSGITLREHRAGQGALFIQKEATP